MPSTSDARAARWPGMDEQACQHLESRGFALTPRWTWVHPDEHVYHLDARDVDAILYLIEEWDFGGIVMARDPLLEKPEFTEADFDQAHREAVAREGEDAWTLE